MTKETINFLWYNFKRDINKVWDLNLPVEEIKIERLLWHFSFSFWFPNNTETIWHVLDNQGKYVQKMKRIEDTDTSYPLHIMEKKWKYLMIDWLHRLAKLYLQWKKTVKVKIIPQSYLPKIKPDDGISHTSYWN